MMNTLADLLEDELKDLYSAENQLLKALPRLSKKATSKTLKSAIDSHFTETQGQVARLEKIGKELEIKMGGKVCHAMKGLVEEGKEVLEEKGKGAVIDAAIIGACQRVEHYEMAGYGVARALAEQLGHDAVVKLLTATLAEESAADKKLTTIAEDEVLVAAAAEGEESEEE